MLWCAETRSHVITQTYRCNSLEIPPPVLSSFFLLLSTPSALEFALPITLDHFLHSSHRMLSQRSKGLGMKPFREVGAEGAAVGKMQGKCRGVKVLGVRHVSERETRGAGEARSGRTVNT